MTPLSRNIFENYQTRKTKKQKTAFIALLKQHFPEMQVQTGSFPRCRNLIIGDVETAKVVFTAHYDTCARLLFPNFIAPKNTLLCVAYSILICLPIFLGVWLVNLLMNLVTDSYWLHYWVSLVTCFGFLGLMIFGPANKHTANDNTSGVIVLCELLEVLPEPLRKKAAFVFFDHEETGLVGSALFRSKYKKQMQEKLLINFDCVSDGDTIMLALSKAARKDFGELADRCFPATEDKSILLTRAEKIYFPSDQLGFPVSIAVAALKKKPILGYYMDKIHTARDREFDQKNLKLLCESSLRLLQKL